MSATRGRLFAACLALAALLLTLTCGEDKGIPTGSLARPDVLKKISGDKQGGVRLQILEQPLTVQVLDSDGNPVPSHTVRFEVTGGNGSMAGSNEKAQEAVTNNSGITSAYLVFGTDSLYSVTATATGISGAPLSGSPMDFSAYAKGAAGDTSGGGGVGPPPTTGAYTVVGVSLGVDTVGSVGRIFRTPLAVRVTDSTGAGVPAVDIFYSAFIGGGVFDIDTKTTNSFGVAANAVRLGYLPGINIIQASVVLPNGSVGRVQWRILGVRDVDVKQNAWDIAMVLPEGVDSLVGVAGQELPIPLVVAVTDTFGRGSPQQVVTWLVETGGGIFDFSDQVTSTTSSEGIAQAPFTLGPKPGLNRVRATIIRDDGTPVSVFFDVWGIVAPPVAQADTILIVSGNGQTGEVNALLPLPFVVRVLDDSGDPMPGVDVTFSVRQGGGAMGKETEDPSARNYLTIKTDVQGQAVITLRLGPGPDLDNVVVAEIRRTDGQVISVSFSAQALPIPDTANKLYIMSGNNQGWDGEYAVGSLLPLPLVFRVVDTTRTGVGGDTLGAPISNFPVILTAYGPSGDGSLNDSPNVEPDGTGRLEARTDADGLAAVRFTLNSQTGGPDDIAVLRGNNIVVAVAVFADGSQDSVIFRATAVPQAPANISAGSSTDRTAAAGGSLGGLSVSVTDAKGNMVAGAGVSWSIGSLPAGGSATLSTYSTTTDTYGRASIDVTQVSTKTGAMKVSAYPGFEANPVTFTITVNPDVPAEIVMSGGSGQSSKAGTAFAKALRVLVFDRYRNPIKGALVSFTVTGGSASLDNNAVVTDADGAAQSICTPYVEGAITVEASTTISGATQKVTFNLTATAP